MLSKSKVYMALIISLLILMVSIISYKLFVLKYPISALIPVEAYSVELTMEVDGHGDDVTVSTYLPLNSARQSLTNETFSSTQFQSEQELVKNNRRAVWRAENLKGHHRITYETFIQAKHIAYTMDETLKIPQTYPEHLQVYLEETAGIQVHDPLIAQKIKTLFKQKPTLLYPTVKTIYDDLQDNFANKNFSGFTDALTALKLKEASCNGKSRLFVAILRKLNIPARLIGGLILKNGSKKTSHQWVEVYIEGHWVPFDTINHHFMELPSNYLTLYYGDKSLFSHSVSINFNYKFTIKKQLIQNVMAQSSAKSSSFTAFNFYEIFAQIGISQNLLKIILMIPIGALVIVIFRNVIGIETFGTFLPALIATAARETGLFWGLVGFMAIIIIAAVVRKFLDWLGLLHSPKMAIMLTFVVIALLLFTMIGVELELFALAHISLFPIAILAITAERFAIIEAEEGLLKALKLSFTTMLVIIAAYLVMTALFMQSLFIAFPELLLLVIVLNLWIGKWIGIRLTEFIRFRKLIFGKQDV